MSSLFATLGTAGNALDVLQRAMGVIQNNVSNSATPGYVSQSLQLNAAAFNPAANLWGGVQAGNVQSARNNFAEASVWSTNQQVGSATQQASSLQSVQSAFDITGDAGIPGALNTLTAAFSAWSTTPASSTAQQQVLSAAQGLGQAFASTASQMEDVRRNATEQTRSTVGQINQLASQIAVINGQIRDGGKDDSGLQSQLYNSLEQLSNLVDISAHPESDGTFTVLMGGQVPLVIGKTQTEIRPANTNPPGGLPNAPPVTQILTGSGQDVTDRIGGGSSADFCR